ncbi:MAG: virulence RhuM family protein [Bacteroidales bacterium]|nr:virulence RhuM family protein [Bacteroidales bacterium]
MDNHNVVVYKTESSNVKLEVKVSDETVWLTQTQMAILFDCSTDNISLHLKNIYEEHEIDSDSTSENFSVVRLEGNRRVTRTVKHYNLDAILSVGYRVSSASATKFRQWANSVLKDYLLRGYAVHQRIVYLEQKVAEHDKKIDFFVKTSLPPVEGIFHDGQIFDAYNFISDLVRKAKNEIILIDNYVDDSVLKILNKRENNVSATIYTAHISENLKLDLKKHNSQYQPINIKQFNKSHDRFMIIDNEVYHIGASLKDLGKRIFAFSKMEIGKEIILSIL